MRYGQPLRLGTDETPRELGRRVEAAVATLLDEDRTDWYAAARRAASGSTPAPSGPDVARWRRVWESTASPTARNRRPKAWR